MSNDSRYAVIGWGSLIWDLDNLAPHVEGEWLMEAGPRLDMEFTRVSPKRKLGLAVCIDPEHGVPCATHVIASRRSELEAAITDLAARERAPIDRIGGVCIATGAAHGRGEVASVIRDWCRSAGWRGAVWTDLVSNYSAMQGERFTVGRAIAYLKTLEGDSLNEAVRYIESAPLTTDTPLRRALSAYEWWQDEVARLSASTRWAHRRQHEGSD